MQQDARIEHPHEIGVGSECEEGVARGPGRHAGEQHPLHAEPAEEPRHHEHEEDFGHLAERHLAGRVGDVQLVQKQIGERVIELQRDADQERAEDEDRERALAQQLERVEAEDGADRHLAFLRDRRRVRQGETEQPEHHRSGGRNLQRPCGRLEAERPDEQARHDPADRPEDANQRELAAGIVHLPERQRVAQRQRRHVAERVDQQHDVERTEARLQRREIQHGAAGDVQRGENALGRHEPIGDHADEERRNDCGDRRRPRREADLLAGEVQRLPEPRPHRHVPRAPHEVLQEHHRRQFRARGRGHPFLSPQVPESLVP